MKTLLFILAVFFSFNAKSQLRELRFDQLSVENGLPENYATCSLQDHLGYIWIGTQNGLVRYDGYQAKVYKLETADKKERILCVIRTLFEDSKGNLWVGTFAQGLFTYDRLTEKFIEFTHGSPEPAIAKNEEILTIVEDKNGSIWTRNLSGDEGRYHLDMLDPKSGLLISFDSKTKDIAATVFNSLVSDSKGNIWLGTDIGLYQYEPALKKLHRSFPGEDIRFIYEAPSRPGTLWLSKWNSNEACLTGFNTHDGKSVSYRHNISQPASLLNDTVLTIFEDHKKRLWIGTMQGVSLLDQQTKTFTSYQPDGKNNAVGANDCFDIKEDQNGALWILSGKGVLYLSSTNAPLQRFTAEHDEPGALPDNIIYNSLIDRNGLLWLGTFGFGILRLNEQRARFEYIHKSDRNYGYPGVSVIDIAVLNDGQLLVSTSKGLYQCDTMFSKFLYVPLIRDKGSELQTRDIVIDKDGIAWIGSSEAGLFRYDPKTKQVKQYVNDRLNATSLAHNSVRRIYEDSKGRLWVGTWGGGLCGLNKETGAFKRFPFVVNAGKTPSQGALDDDQVMSLYEDRKGVLWIGTNKGGLNRFNEKQNNFTSYQDPDKGLLSVNAINEDHLGKLWVGTNLWGLFLFDPGKNSFRPFRESDGLLYDNVKSITEDRFGQLWIASGRGFSVIDPQNFKIRHLTTVNGLPNNELTAANLIMPDGSWLTGTTHGIIRFSPDKLASNTVPPEVHLQTVTYTKQRNGKAIEAAALIYDQTKLEFGHNENRISFQYVGIHYSNSALNQYKYQLIGYDKDWITAGNQRKVTYTNLSPGTYTFQVKAANSDGIWNEHAATLTVVIHQPWWDTWYAYTLYCILLASSIWGYVTYRSRILKRENKVLEERVEHRTAQLTRSLEDLKSTQAQLIQSEKMASLGALTAGIAHEIQNPLNFVNNFSEVSVELVNEMEDEIDRGNTLEVKNIAGDVKQNLEKIIHHGKRADAIVKGMLQHSRQSTGLKEPTDLHAMIDEYLRLAYHAFRANDKSFTATIQTSFDDRIGEVNIIPQDISKVLLNVFSNAFYSLNEKRKRIGDGFTSMLSVNTIRIHDKIEIKVKDNGIGISSKSVANIFQPFFTTKPTGQGTGLGLSLSYDIIRAHGGEIKVEAEEGEYATFIIELPVS